MNLNNDCFPLCQYLGEEGTKQRKSRRRLDGKQLLVIRLNFDEFVETNTLPAINACIIYVDN